MPLIVVGLILLGQAIHTAYLARHDGGYRQLMRSRRGLPTNEGSRSWESLTLSAKYWLRAMPVLVALGMAAVLAGLAIEVT